MWLLLATFLLTLGLIATTVFAAAIKVACFRNRVNAFEVITRGGAFGVLIALATLAALACAGVELDNAPFRDALQNGAAAVLIAALVGTTAATVRVRRPAVD